MYTTVYYPIKGDYVHGEVKNMALTEIQIRQAKPKDKRFMLRDDRGLYLEVMPSGNKHWRLRCWEGGREHRIDLGQYPGVPRVARKANCS